LPEIAVRLLNLLRPCTPPPGTSFPCYSEFAFGIMIFSDVLLFVSLVAILLILLLMLRNKARKVEIKKS
jgi:hypothetical protein